jgi:hypothetical protein
MRYLRPGLVFLLALLAALTLASGALAAGGNYVFDSGTPGEQQQVREALDASSFDWSIVRATITVHIASGIDSEATPGQIWLDSELLDAGRFSWGVVQHEYAHQVDFELFDDATRAKLDALLGGVAWYAGGAPLRHEQIGCERFASTLAWSYWQSPDNSMKPTGVANDESAAMEPAQFRALMSTLLGLPAPATTASANQLGHAPPRLAKPQAVKLARHGS